MNDPTGDLSDWLLRLFYALGGGALTGALTAAWSHGGFRKELDALKDQVASNAARAREADIVINARLDKMESKMDNNHAQIMAIFLKSLSRE